MSGLTFNQKRLCLGIAFIVAVVCVANYEFGWSLFGPVDPKKPLIASVIAMVLIQRVVGPSFDEVRGYRDGRRRR